jgi:lysozyme family protein
MTTNLNGALSKEYVELWRSCVIRPSRVAEVDAIVNRMVAHKDRYTKAGKPHGVPWNVVAVIHMLEGSGSFSTHLHNGDPLTARTVHVPKGRPKDGTPPFKWEASASDALVFDGLSTWKNWTLPGTLFALERFNGFGYRAKKIQIHSPYLWSFSNQYSMGKFVSDGHFSPSAVSQQCGAAVLLRRMVGRGLVEIAGATANGS